MDAIVGRDAELAAVERFLNSIPESPAALVIEGEVGIGKTTVWHAAIRAAHSRGYQVVSARPAESEASLSYSALADLVGDAFDDTRAVLPPPQERALAAALLRTDIDEPADARTTATGLVTVLAALANQRPALVAIDDVQWLDPASRRALEFAARRLPPRVGLVVTKRTEERGHPPLGLDSALPEGRLESLVPGPLSVAALHHLMRSRLGTSLARPTLIRLAAASAGNPLFALEIARALESKGGGGALGDPLPLPPTLEELVAARVRDLTPRAEEAVLVAAALSRPTVATLDKALASRGDAHASLVEAEEAGVLVSNQGRIRFTHPLLASVVYGSASHERRRQLHKTLARVVRDREERARHLAQSSIEADETTAAELEEAARRAAQRGAQDAAAELFEASCRLTPADRPTQLIRRTLGEGSALLAMGDVLGARSRAEHAAGASPEPLLRAQALFLLSDIAWIEGMLGSAVEHLESALAESPDDSELSARIHAKLVSFNVPRDPVRAMEHADSAMGLLSNERDPGLLAYVLFGRFFAEAMLGRGERHQLFEQGLELEARAGPGAPKSSIPLIWYRCTDDFAAARARHAMEDEWYRQRGDDGWRAERLAHLGLAELHAGQWVLAERYVEESCAAIEQLEPHGPWTAPFFMRSLVDAHRGRVARACETLVPLIEETEQSEKDLWSALLLSTLAFVEFTAGEYEAADLALMRMRAHIAAIGAREFPPDRSEPFHVESLLALGELERAHDVLRRLEERGRVLPRLWITTTLPRVRALVLAAEGDVWGALGELDSLDIDAASRLPFEFARTLLVQGQLYRRAKQKRRAATALGQAIDIFDRLGAPAWAERARSELARVGLRRSPAELTPSELRVAELAASGLTNREVAKAAFMSPKTVQANLTRVYRKLGIHSRAELGARMADERRDVGPQT